MKKSIIFCFLMAIASIVMISCKKDETTYTVSFNSKGGTPTPQEQTVKKGSRVTKPADPTRANYSLTGWTRADNETDALWNFETETVTGDMTLFARWTIITHVVTFDSDGGSAVAAQNVAHGSAAAKPADPTRNGYEFDGWFNGDTQWNFNTAITAPIMLTAKWTAMFTVTFDSDGGSAVPAQTVRTGNTANKPAAPTKAWIAAAGLYLGTPPANGNYTFDGWFYDDTEWNFTNAITADITLKAKWTIDFSLARIESVPANDVPAAFTYANANSTGVEEYALLLDANVMIGEQSINSANVKLTIIGIGVERFITFTLTNVNSQLFSIDGSNANLTLGQNITLMGKTSSFSNTHLVYIQRGSLTMRDGSKITGHNTGLSSGNVVSVEGLNAYFKMEGGEISGNNIAVFFSVVGVSAGATFEMSGGSITDNSSRIDVFIDDTNCTFLLSGSARIGMLALYASNNTTRATITIAGSYSGTVTTLHLRGNSNNANSVATFWTNAPVIVNGTAGVISMFNNGGLGNFTTPLSPTSGTSIRSTHELNASGVLVLK